jgi:hypothetical protein
VEVEETNHRVEEDDEMNGMKYHHTFGTWMNAMYNNTRGIIIGRNVNSKLPIIVIIMRGRAIEMN